MVVLPVVGAVSRTGAIPGDPEQAAQIIAPDAKFSAVDKAARALVDASDRGDASGTPSASSATTRSLAFRLRVRVLASSWIVLDLISVV